MPAYQKSGQTNPPRAFNVTVADQGEVAFPYRFRRLYRNGCALVLGVDYTTTDFKNATGEFAVGEVISAELASATPTTSEMSNMPQTPHPTAIDSTARAAAAAAQSTADDAATDATQALADAATASTAASAAQTDADAAASAAATAQSAADDANEAAGLNPAKGLVFKVYEANKSVSSPTGIEEDGIEVGQTILLAGQSTASQNGAYTFNGNGVAMTRALNSNSAQELMGAFWTDVQGVTWRQTSPVATLGTDDVTIERDLDEYTEYTSTPVTASGAVTSITGLPLARKPGTVVKLYRNGALLIEGAGNDYSVSGTIITVESGVLISGNVYFYTCEVPAGS